MSENERHDKLEAAILAMAERENRPSFPSRCGTWIAAHWIALLIGVAVGFVAANGPAIISLQDSTKIKPAIERKTASEVADIPFQERRIVAEALRTAAARIVAAPDDTAVRYDADEFVRKSVAMQPSAREWQRAFTNISTAVHSPEPLTYAANLELAARGLE